MMAANVPVAFGSEKAAGGKDTGGPPPPPRPCGAAIPGGAARAGREGWPGPEGGGGRGRLSPPAQEAGYPPAPPAESQISGIWLPRCPVPVPGQFAQTGGPVNAVKSWRLFPQIVAVRFGDDLPSVVEFHRHQIVGEIAWRQRGAHLDEGGGIVGAVDGDDEILARLALGPGGRPFPDAIEPIGHGEDLQRAFFQPAQVG